VSKVVLPIHGSDHRRGGPDPIPPPSTIVYHVKLFSDSQVVAVGDGRFTITLGQDTDGYTLQRVRLGVSTVSSSGIVQVQLNRQRGAADMLLTRIQIDANEYDSQDASLPYVIDTANDDVLNEDRIRIDVDSAGTGAKGLEIELLFDLPV
jgi:hypothetical protein